MFTCTVYRSSYVQDHLQKLNIKQKGFSLIYNTQRLDTFRYARNIFSSRGGLDSIITRNSQKLFERKANILFPVFRRQYKFQPIIPRFLDAQTKLFNSLRGKKNQFRFYFNLYRYDSLM